MHRFRILFISAMAAWAMAPAPLAAQTKKDQIAGLQARVDSLHKALRQSKARTTKAMGERDLLSGRIDSLSTVLAKLQEQYASTLQQRDRLSGRIDSLRSALKRSEERTAEVLRESEATAPYGQPTGQVAAGPGATGVGSGNKPWLNPALTYGSVTDIDGNTYATIQIGTQVWMAENLRTTRYRNGDPIPNVMDGTQWENLKTGAWAHYDNDIQYEKPYGKLYNWYAVADPRNVCPKGWHVPTDVEWTVLTNYLGGGNVAGGKMKSTGTQYWDSPNTDATNESGFSGLPGGSRNNGNGFFGYLGNYGNWWSASESGAEFAWYRTLLNGNAGVSRYNYDKRYGFCLRCVRD